MVKMFMKDKGFTLLELMIAVSVLIVAMAGLMAVFTHLISLNENSRKLTLAVEACQDKLEEMRNSNFSTLFTTYNGTSFNPNGFPAGEAKGIVSVNNTNPNLLQVFVSVSWRTRSNRVIGEDKNLNGIVDAGEASGSPAQITTLMSQR